MYRSYRQLFLELSGDSEFLYLLTDSINTGSTINGVETLGAEFAEDDVPVFRVVNRGLGGVKTERRSKLCKY